MKHIWSHCVKFAAVATMIAAGFTHAVQADPYTPYRGEDGIYHYDWFHQSFWNLKVIFKMPRMRAKPACQI